MNDVAPHMQRNNKEMKTSRRERPKMAWESWLKSTSNSYVHYVPMNFRAYSKAAREFGRTFLLFLSIPILSHFLFLIFSCTLASRSFETLFRIDSVMLLRRIALAVVVRRFRTKPPRGKFVNGRNQLEGEAEKAGSCVENWQVWAHLEKNWLYSLLPFLF